MTQGHVGHVYSYSMSTNQTMTQGYVMSRVQLLHVYQSYHDTRSCRTRVQLLNVYQSDHDTRSRVMSRVQLLNVYQSDYDTRSCRSRVQLLNVYQSDHDTRSRVMTRVHFTYSSILSGGRLSYAITLQSITSGKGSLTTCVTI